MQIIPLTNELSIKPLDPKDQKDIWLVDQLDQDQLVKFYLGTFEYVFSNIDSESSDIYDKSYAVMHHTDPIGYLEISRLFGLKRFVNLAYAIIQSERGKKYAKKMLQAISELLLEDLNSIKLTIHVNNLASQAIAVKSGFVPQQTEEEAKKLGYYHYEKTKIMCHQERRFH